MKKSKFQGKLGMKVPSGVGFLWLRRVWFRGEGENIFVFLCDKVAWRGMNVRSEYPLTVLDGREIE